MKKVVLSIININAFGFRTKTYLFDNQRRARHFFSYMLFDILSIFY